MVVVCVTIAISFLALFDTAAAAAPHIYNS